MDAAALAFNRLLLSPTKTQSYCLGGRRRSASVDPFAPQKCGYHVDILWMSCQCLMDVLEMCMLCGYLRDVDVMWMSLKCGCPTNRASSVYVMWMSLKCGSPTNVMSMLCGCPWNVDVLRMLCLCYVDVLWSLRDVDVMWMSHICGCHKACYATFSTIINLVLKRSFGRKQLHYIKPPKAHHQTWPHNFNLGSRVSHLDPIQPIGQVQVYEPSPRLLQVPPFRQGYEAQGSAAT